MLLPGVYTALSVGETIKISNCVGGLVKNFVHGDSGSGDGEICAVSASVILKIN
ncbi:MAG: hypothetical protein ACLRSW_09945 [Christensenellaceae bacterium]